MISCGGRYEFSGSRGAAYEGIGILKVGRDTGMGAGTGTGSGAGGR